MVADLESALDIDGDSKNDDHSTPVDVVPDPTIESSAPMVADTHPPDTTHAALPGVAPLLDGPLLATTSPPV
eukprot:4075649-Karenia_brevis.AAC.1